MCKYIQGNMCSLGHHCHCHPVRDQKTYDDGYFEQDDTTYYDPESGYQGFKLNAKELYE